MMRRNLILLPELKLLIEFSCWPMRLLIVNSGTKHWQIFAVEWMTGKTIALIISEIFSFTATSPLLQEKATSKKKYDSHFNFYPFPQSRQLQMQGPEVEPLASFLWERLFFMAQPNRIVRPWVLTREHGDSQLVWETCSRMIVTSFE